MIINTNARNSVVNNKKCNTSWHFEVSIILLFISGSSAFPIICSGFEGAHYNCLSTELIKRDTQSNKQNNISAALNRFWRHRAAQTCHSLSLPPPPSGSGTLAAEETGKVDSAVILAIKRTSSSQSGQGTEVMEGLLLQHMIVRWVNKRSVWVWLSTIVCGSSWANKISGRQEEEDSHSQYSDFSIAGLSSMDSYDSHTELLVSS